MPRACNVPAATAIRTTRPVGLGICFLVPGLFFAFAIWATRSVLRRDRDDVPD